MAAAMETMKCKSTDVPRSPKLMANAASRPGSISPALSPLSPALMELDDYRPSLADQIRVGYFSQDRSAQTNVSEIIQLKEMTEVLQNLVSDIETLKRSLHYAKHVLQADYENKLQERALDLYCRVNDRILELEKQHEERVNVIRRSYRQQLADAITQIANQHEVYYVKKSKQDNAAFSQKLKKVQDDDDENRKAQQQQDSLIEMMKMQMKDAQERADRQLEEALQRKQSVSSVSTDPEIYELRDEVEKLENKLDEMMNQLEDKETENRRLAHDIDDLNEELNRERVQTRQLKRELSDALLSAEQERNSFKAENTMPFDQESTNSMLNVEDNNKVDHSTVLFLVRILKLSCETMFEKITPTV
ncbi:PREDICTED: myosin-11-like [Acropora digitifera]|uniref:myosin-11-like n=1 Tax=Acropora digitifera TaxID=70779 RepID=UPI00077A5718|nr:PREDICTED: myosin-11-like [Acropora digitifera]